MDANGSLWSATSAPPAFGRLESDLGVDVVIAGGGITGLTAALELAEQGRRVAVLEARTVGSGVTGRSTAHATEIVDARYQTIEARFGLEGSRLVAASSRAAIERIAKLAERVGAPLKRRCGYLYTERETDLASLREEHDAALRAGLELRDALGDLLSRSGT